MTTKTLIGALLVSFASFAPACAETFAFRYRPHELQTDGGRTAMMARLDSQVDRYCDVAGARGLHTRHTAKECAREIVAEIVSKIDNVQFASLK